MSERLCREGVNINSFEDWSGTRFGTGESSYETLSTSSAGSARCSTDFHLPSLMKESRRNSDKLHHALQSLTLNTFRDPAGRALVESVKAILAGDVESRPSGDCRHVAQDSFQRQSSSDGVDADRIACNQDGSCKSDLGSQTILHHRQQSLASPTSSEARTEELEEGQTACSATIPMDKPAFHSNDAGENSQRLANLTGASSSSLATGTSSQSGGQPLNSSDVNMHDWQVWASHVSELLSTFSNELVSLGSRVDQMCSNLGAPPSVSSTLPCIMEETHVEETSIASDSEPTVEPSKMCEASHESCEQRFAILSSRLDTIEQSLKIHDFTERARRLSRIGDISFESDCTAPADNFMEMPVSTLRASLGFQEMHEEDQQVSSLRPLESAGFGQSEQKVRHEVFSVGRSGAGSANSSQGILLSQLEVNIDDDAYQASVRKASIAERESSRGMCSLEYTRNDVVKLDFALRPEHRCIVENAGTPALHNDDLSGMRAQHRTLQLSKDSQGFPAL